VSIRPSCCIRKNSYPDEPHYPASNRPQTCICGGDIIEAKRCRCGSTYLECDGHHVACLWCGFAGRRVDPVPDRGEAIRRWNEDVQDGGGR